MKPLSTDCGFPGVTELRFGFSTILVGLRIYSFRASYAAKIQSWP